MLANTTPICQFVLLPIRPSVNYVFCQLGLLPDGVVVAPEFNIENPSSSFKVTVSGLPFGEDEFVSSYLVIVASEDHPTDELNNTLPS